MNQYPARQVKSNREAFELVKEHLLSQKEKSISDSGCLYRGPRSYDDIENHLDFWKKENAPMACAVGCLISDDVYSLEIEEMLASNYKIQRRVILSHPDWEFNEVSVTILSNLQSLHDRVAPELWSIIFDNTDISFWDKEEFSEFLTETVKLYDGNVSTFEEVYRAALIVHLKNEKERRNDS